MGIIITIVLLLALVAVLAKTLRIESSLVSRIAIQRAIGLISLAAGLWNACWYGVQHLSEFWGMAAFASGVALISAAAFILTPYTVRWLQLLCCVALLVFFLLYAVTIIRLNLGMPVLA